MRGQLRGRIRPSRICFQGQSSVEDYHAFPAVLQGLVDLFNR